MDVSIDGRRLAVTCSHARGLIVARLDVEVALPTRAYEQLVGADQILSGVHWNPHNAVELASSSASNVCVWDVERAQRILHGYNHRHSVTAVQWASSRARVLASGDAGGSLCFWDARSAGGRMSSDTSMLRPTHDDIGIRAIRWHPRDMMRFVTVHLTSTLLWDVRNHATPYACVSLTDSGYLVDAKWSSTSDNLLLAGRQCVEAHSSSDPEQSPLYTTSLASATTGAEVEALYARGNDHITVTLRDGAVMELREDDLSVVSSAMPFGEGGLDLSAICSGDVPAIVYGLGRDGIVRRHALDQREDDIAANEVIHMPGFTNKAKDALPFDTPDTNDNDGKSIDMMLPAHMLRRLEMEQMREAFPAIHIEADKNDTHIISTPILMDDGLSTVHVRLRIIRPDGYPLLDVPKFEFLDHHAMPTLLRKRLYRGLNIVARECMEKCKLALGPCLHYLLSGGHLASDVDGTLIHHHLPPHSKRSHSLYGSESMMQTGRTTTPPLAHNSDSEGSDGDGGDVMDKTIAAGNVDRVPFPRLCGASFGPDGILVIFTSPRTRESMLFAQIPRTHDEYKRMKRMNVVHENLQDVQYASMDEETDGESSMGQLASSGGARGSSLGLSVSPPRLHTRKRASQRIGTGSSSGMLYYDLALHRNVQLVDCRQWIPCSRDLAVHFKTQDENGSVGFCVGNAIAASMLHREDLAAVWRLVGSLLYARQHNSPICQHIALSLLAHYERLRDTQMVAILAVVFLSADDEHKHKRNNIERSRPASALSTLAMRSSIGGELALPLLCERKGRLHWMKTPGRAVDRPLEVFRRSRPHRRPMASSALPPSPPPPPPKFITIEHSERLARYIYAYTELLYRWGLLEQRTDIMRYVVTADNGGTGDTLLSASGPHYLTVCHTCGTQLLSDVCTKCQKFGMRCVICHQPARGLAVFCSRCGHGGHHEHMTTWFDMEFVCPSGCGCACILEDL